MNIEAAQWRRDALADGEIVDETIIIRNRRRRNIIVAAVAAIVVALIAIAALMGGGEEKAAGPAAKGGAAATPRVTVIVPGRQQVARLISATGTLAARRDMPVGVSGEGGTVARVLVEPGQWVGAGQTLAVIERSVQSQQAQQLAAQIDVARADAALAASELKRAQALVARGFVSQADIDRKQATLNAANARVRVAQAQLAETRARIGKLDVRAPAAGLVLDRMVEPGQVVSAGSGALFRIAMGGEMEMLARLSQEDLTRLSPGVPASVTPVGSAQTVSGSVWQVSPVIDPQTRQGEARISIPYNRAIRPGGFASAEIRAGALDAPLLPESAVQSDDKGNFVYIIDGRNKVVRRDVQIGDVSDAGVAIVGGLQGNERVVESAGAFLNPGDTVQPVRATANR
ncbi:efflux RND transporter periplasmic adaptor subunit [Allosphingosinicella flava]|uniref:Efflux RND transporter periplasmic adaptor subunit n=1 Tax=Allosphingosinicella flava TaxID=2771430 RepID=A0A7T2GJB6_9SPHN|nr:efflux RND transporter periplasmic adaptor subunit [Sphingosinicella flava]QPQ54914.1 efflux RND transporter periplasmic adaptor subunit [Sphingosinicella flava]